MVAMTKPCKACKEQIDAAATKCPRCQAFQHWYRNPQLIPLVLLIPFFVFVIPSMLRLSGTAVFADYRDKLSVSVVDEGGSTNAKTSLVTIRLENRTDKTWKRPKIQIESLDADGKIVSVEHVNEYNLVVAPNSSVLDTVSLRIIPAQSIAKRRATLTDIDSNRY
jgi:hypothetical protein